ncbi:E3 ubiquitin-protein ligase ZNF598 [Bicyclus anynana]|uniref:RING-type E3 ubiquitin transferase n=1 Tax=Bicyclus anynana TaxID=110368 RepID=A0A6J1MPT1_BICAN|nr:E3 ubiquitin-protein ligase ZNF598 [Bicyclus anynana]
MAESQLNDNTTCVVCFKTVVYYSVGECDHPVCFECSTRMRVLCLQNECPICRQDLSRVVFTNTVQPYKDLRNRAFPDKLLERQYKIGFCSEEIRQAYERLLENRCKVCEKIPPFRTFSMLNDHMRKVHEQYYCDLCVKHLKIFTSERRCYTRQELAHHRRKGDVDDTSHRGHPLCEFCEERFMDADELYRHLRKEHLYCHLCDADGRNLYYASHAALAQHFRAEHHLCEEGECAGQHLTAVFRSEIDLKAHKATVHGKGMPRGAARQARTLELQFNITPHPVVQRAPRDRDRQVQATPASPPPPPPPQPSINPQSDEQFPRLSAAQPAPAPLVAGPARAFRGAGGLTRNDKNFPALDGSNAPSAPRAPSAHAQPVAATVLRNSSKPSVSIQVHTQPSASNFRLTQTSGNRISISSQKKQALSDDDFPSLGVARDDHPSIGAGTVQAPKVTLINSDEMRAFKSNQSNSQPKKTQHGSAEAFPALSSSSAPTAPPQWITVSKSKEKGKHKPDPPPVTIRENNFNPVADFPTLPVNKAKTKKSQPHQPQPQPYQQSNNNNENKTKKDKKKQNKNLNNLDNNDYSFTNGFNDLNIKKEHIAASVNNNNNSLETDRKIKTFNETPTVQRNAGNGDFSLAPKEYPPLNPRAADSYQPPVPKKDNFASKIVQNGSAPPGLKKRPPCDGMTFTNSAGQTFPAPVHSYIPPPNFEQRNRALVKQFAAALGEAAAVEDFKVASRAFRDSIISADEFFEHCKTALGSQLESVFPNLVALLPDIAKQQELVVGRDISSKLEVCSTCGQLLSPDDAIAHDTAHWPALSSR